MDIDQRLEELRKKYVSKPELREVIKRQARALEIAKELSLKNSAPKQANFNYETQ